MKKRYWIGGIFVVLILFVIIANSGNKNGGDIPGGNENRWQAVRDKDVAQVSGTGWSVPQRFEVSTDFMEDGPYISGDGNKLYFIYYEEGVTRDIDIFVSEKPFITKTRADISTEIFSDGGLMIDGNDFYYMSNKLLPGEPEKSEFVDDNIYKNDEVLSFNDPDIDEEDPHYCAEKDELYFWYSSGLFRDGTHGSDGEIYVFKNDELTKLPAPINDGGENIQPFLTTDCQTMYFTSSRGGRLKIFKSERLGEDEWDVPELFISSKVAVGEPTMTDDGKLFSFVQAFVDKGKRNFDIFYIEKV